jgi:hypothetical protein
MRGSMTCSCSIVSFHAIRMELSLRRFPDDIVLVDVLPSKYIMDRLLMSVPGELLLFKEKM